MGHQSVRTRRSTQQSRLHSRHLYPGNSRRAESDPCGNRSRSHTTRDTVRSVFLVTRRDANTKRTHRNPRVRNASIALCEPCDILADFFNDAYDFMPWDQLAQAKSFSTRENISIIGTDRKFCDKFALVDVPIGTTKTCRCGLDIWDIWAFGETYRSMLLRAHQWVRARPREDRPTFEEHFIVGRNWDRDLAHFKVLGL